MILRPYQNESVEAVWNYLRERDDAPVVVLPTGAGKTPVIAALIRDAVTKWNGRVLVLAHVKELLEQGLDKLNRFAPGLNPGVYSAGLGKRELENPVIFAGIQSAHNVGAGAFGPRDVVLVDECHLISPADGTMYNQFLSDCRIVCPHSRLVGLTATPYRLNTGAIFGPGQLFGDIAHEVGVRDLIEQGFLSPLTNKPTGQIKIDVSGVKLSGGEFNSGNLETAALRGDIVQRAVDDLLLKSDGRKSVLVFAIGKKHAEAVTDCLRERGQVASMVDGETPSLERGWTVTEFKSGAIRFLVNIGVFTTGFDCPSVDCVAMLRPTMSPGLYYQMCGRGFRLHPGKTDCLILDYAGNISRHGPVDAIRVPRARVPGEKREDMPQKRCDHCGEMCHPACTVCPACDAPFPERDTPAHFARPDETNHIISKTTIEEFDVGDIEYTKHIRRKLKPGETSATPTMRVSYYEPGAGTYGRQPIASEFVCFEHTGFALGKARAWWAKRSNDPFPTSVDMAVSVANNGGVANATKIKIRTEPNKNFPEIISHELQPKPQLEHDATRSPTAEDLDFLNDLPF